MSSSMNEDDLLSRATRALRDDGHADDDDEVAAADTLMRVERSMRVRRLGAMRNKKLTRWIVMPMAASFLVFCAWASASGRLSHWVSREHPSVEHDETHEPPPTVVTTPSARAVVIVPLPSAVVVEEEEEAAAPSALSSASIKAAPLPPIDTDALYREAHDAHFVRKDPAAALVLWDRYIAAAGPSGRFTLEARYNRAIELVRLNRRAEAATALRPFANGDYGGYRRDEARELLRTLE